MAVAAIGSALAPMLTGLHPAWVSLAAFGAGATAFSSFASTREAVSQSRRNAELYSQTLSSLRMLERKLDEVRTAAVAGNVEAVRVFVSSAHDLMAAEHRQWLEAGKNVQPALDKLEAALRPLEPKQEQKKTGGG